MSVTTFEAVIENGQIRLPVRGSSCPNGKSSTSSSPETTAPLERAQAGFRLANPADAAKFEMKVAWGEES